MSTTDTVKTLCAAFQQTASRFPDLIALRTRDDEVSITWREYAERVRRVAGGLASLGVGAGGTVALMLTNRPEFHIVDAAVLHTGATPLSIYNTFATEQIRHVLADSGATVVVCEQRFLDKVLESTSDTDVEHVVCVDGDPEGAVALDELTPDPEFDFEAAWRAVGPLDVLTVIYTSGTTGPPKGVELTHENMMTEVSATRWLMGVTSADNLVSYLPDAHVANRWGAHYTSMCTGLRITTVADMKELPAALADARPTILGAVPQVWYKIKASIDATVAAEPSAAKRALISWAIGIAGRKARLTSGGEPVPATVRAGAALADRLVLSAVRTKLGFDRVRVAASGAAAIAPETLEFMLALGIPVCEMWGMSETSAVVLMNPPDAIRIGTVGLPLPCAEVELAEDGELLVRGPLVMKGYRDNPAKTAETVDADGWLHTGDIARIDDDGYVSIVDRKKELIVNAAGKNMSPANIENLVKAAGPLAGFVTVIGNDRPYLTALVTLEPEAAAARAEAAGMSATSTAALAEHPDIRAEIQRAVDAANTRLARVEQIKRFAILPVSWEPGGDEVTPSVKLRRKQIDWKYAEEIEGMYA